MISLRKFSGPLGILRIFLYCRQSRLDMVAKRVGLTNLDNFDSVAPQVDQVHHLFDLSKAAFANPGQATRVRATVHRDTLTSCASACTALDVVVLTCCSSKLTCCQKYTVRRSLVPVHKAVMNRLPALYWAYLLAFGVNQVSSRHFKVSQVLRH
jgi:hypothetical protein